MRSILGAVLVMLVIFKGTHGWCSICPGVSIPEGKPQPCRCHDAFYNPSTRKCVGYFNCPLFETLLGPNNLESFISTGMETMASSLIVNTATTVAEAALNRLVPNVTTVVEAASKRVLQYSQDIDVINSLLRSRFVRGFPEVYRQFSFLINPYLLGNRKLLEECNDNNMCVLQKLMQRNSKRLEGAITATFPHVINKLILSLSDIEDYASLHCDRGCPIIEKVVGHREFINNFLLSLKNGSGAFIKFVIDVLIHLKPMENDAFNKILSYLHPPPT